MQLQSMNTQVQVMDSMGAASKIMGKVNKDMDVQQIMSMMKEYQKEQMKFEMKGEMMADAMDQGEVEGEADDVYNQILGELSLDASGIGAVGTGAVGQPQPAAAVPNESAGELDDLEARLNALQ